MKAPSASSALASARSASLSRRHFLRGLGACLTLPAFESLHPFTALGATASSAGNVATTASGAPLRTAFVFFPNGAIPSAWWPAKEGADFQFGKTLEPLAQNKNMLQVMGGLDQKNAIGGLDGGGDHARGNGVFLTGARLKKSATDIHGGISIDQAIANQIGHLTRFSSLELTCDSVRKSGACDSNYSCAYQFNISWSSPTTPMTPEANPRLVFERLFGVGSPGERVANMRRREVEQRSILDFVMNDAERMQKQLGARDKEKLDQYLTGVREIEVRIQKAGKLGHIKDPGIETPAGVPPDHAEYIQIMYELMALAFQTDSTRVATFCLAHDGDNRSFADIGISEGHHDLSHHQNKEERINKVAQIDQWYARQFAKFLQRLQNTKDVDGKSLLQNSMIVYGGGNADGNRHTHTNLPIVLAGGGGGTFKPGRYTNYDSTPTCNLFLSMADRMGAKMDRFGDSTGRLSNI
jgi:hypothetical protein